MFECTHHEAQRQIVAQQALMLWCQDKTTAEEVHTITRSGVLADDQVQCCSLPRGGEGGAPEPACSLSGATSGTSRISPAVSCCGGPPLGSSSTAEPLTRM